MPQIPLGIGAYKRTYGSEPEIRLENRFVEKNPTNLKEGTSLLSRPGSAMLTSFDGGNMRGSFSQPGLFNSDLFTVSGPNFYRYASDGTKTHITGLVNGDGEPQIAWMKGAGYEYLFISDGLLLQYYSGGSHASGVLTLTPSSPPDISSQVIEIGGTYYSWNANVDTNSPDGSATNPWLAKLGTDDADSLANMAKLINFDGTRGVDFSTTLGGPNPYFSAASDTTTLTTTAFSPYADGNAITTTVYSGSALAWGGAAMSGGNVHALSGVLTPDGVSVKALASVSGYVLLSVAFSQRFYWINPGEVTIDPLNFASKESHPDNIIDMIEIGDQVLVMGAGSTENWYASGDANAPFVPQQGRVYQRGVIAGTAARYKDSVALVSNDGKVYVIGTNGVTPISNYGIEERIRKQLRSEQGLS